MKNNLSAENKKSEILQIATKLFAERGYHATNLDDVAKKFGVTRAAIYYYYGSKSKIICEISNMCIKRMQQVIDMSKSDLSPLEKLKKFIEFHVNLSAQYKNEAQVFFSQASAFPKRTRNVIRRYEKEEEAALQRILKEGVEQGYFTVDDYRMTSFAILGICNWCHQWYKPTGELTVKQISEHFETLIERALLLTKSSST